MMPVYNAMSTCVVSGVFNFVITTECDCDMISQRVFCCVFDFVYKSYEGTCYPIDTRKRCVVTVTSLLDDELLHKSERFGFLMAGILVLGGRSGGGRRLGGACSGVAALVALRLVGEVGGAVGAAVLQGARDAHEGVGGGARVGLALSGRARGALLGARLDVAARVAHVLVGPEAAGGGATPLGATAGAHERGKDRATLCALAEGRVAVAAGKTGARAVRRVAAGSAQSSVVPRISARTAATSRAAGGAVEGVRGSARRGVASSLVARRASCSECDGNDGRKGNDGAHMKRSNLIEV